MSVHDDRPPGLHPERLAALIRRCVDSMALDLSGTTVLTEAATGAYVVTPVLAGLAGADRVIAVTRSTRFGSVDDVIVETTELADLLGVTDRIEIRDERPSREMVRSADIITNSGHVRPIDAEVASWMRPDAVVPLMFEAWEIDLGRDDVDLAALGAAGVRYAGTNERHPAVEVFSYLGPMAVKLLADAAISTYGARLLLLCDNPFLPYLRDGLERAGAEVVTSEHVDIDLVHDDLDAVIVALLPGDQPVLSDDHIAAIAERAHGTLVAQFWGDVPRDRCLAHGVPCTPADDPGAGHMGVLPSAVGPEPIVRLQAGGLKVGELLHRGEATWTDGDRRYVDEV